MDTHKLLTVERQKKLEKMSLGEFNSQPAQLHFWAKHISEHGNEDTLKGVIEETEKVIAREEHLVLEAQERSKRHSSVLAVIALKSIEKAKAENMQSAAVLNTLNTWLVKPLEKDPNIYGLQSAVSVNILERGLPLVQCNLEIRPRSQQDIQNPPYEFSFPFPEDLAAYRILVEVLQPRVESGEPLIGADDLLAQVNDTAKFPQTTLDQLGATLPQKPVYLRDVNQLLVPTIYPDVMLAVSSPTDRIHPWLDLVVKVEDAPFTPLSEVVSPTILQEKYYDIPSGIVNEKIASLITDYRANLRESLPKKVEQFRASQGKASHLERELNALSTQFFRINPATEFNRPSVKDNPLLQSILDRDRMVEELFDVLDSVVLKPEMNEYDFLNYCKLRHVLALTPDEVIADVTAIHILLKLARNNATLDARLESFVQQIEGTWEFPRPERMLKMRMITEYAIVKGQ